ncbi:MAG TPA: hypothetical protein VK168_05750 [Saprospiraceae bacterium]|nr:hypothetical protein [Saprospiraceae bacterium]
MEFKQLDSTVKSALENLQMPYDPSSWDALESRLNAMPAPDAIDQRMRPALERLEPAFDELSWHSLASKMDGLARARRVKWIKATEAALILLLLMNVKSVFEAVDPTHKAPVAPKIENNEPIASKSGKRKAQTTLNPTATIQGNQTAEILAAVSQLFSNENTDQTPVQTSQIPGTDENLAGLETNHVFSTNLLAPASMAFLPASLRHIAAPQPVAAALNLPQVNKTGAGPFYAGFAAQYDQNYLVQADHRDQKSGYGAALVVGYRKGKWGVETGVQYANKTYQPKRDLVEYENNPFQGISFYYNNEVNADVVSLPVKATRRVFKAGKTSGHVVAAVTGHFAASKSYQYNSVHYPPPVPIPNPNPVSESPIPAPPAKGILENGGMTYNAYATADIGFRLERAMGNRYSAFIEPVYRQSLGGGLGPVASRLNTVSIQAGVLATL